jgi:hypothetical protein
VIVIHGVSCGARQRMRRRSPGASVTRRGRLDPAVPNPWS